MDHRMWGLVPFSLNLTPHVFTTLVEFTVNFLFNHGTFLQHLCFYLLFDSYAPITNYKYFWYKKQKMG